MALQHTQALACAQVPYADRAVGRGGEQLEQTDVGVELHKAERKETHASNQTNEARVWHLEMKTPSLHMLKRIDNYKRKQIILHKSM